MKPTIVDKIDDGAGVDPIDERFEAAFQAMGEAARDNLDEHGAFDPDADPALVQKVKQAYKAQGERGIDNMQYLTDKWNNVQTIGSSFVNNDTPVQRSEFFTARVPVNYDKIEHIVENAVSNLLNPAIAAMTVEPGNDQEADQEISEMEMDRATMEYLASKAIAAEAPPAGARASQAPTVVPSPGDEAAADAVAGVETGGLQSPLLLGGLALLAASGVGLVLWKLSKSSSQGGQTL